ncbi:alcohol dehydrogenase catalytic domain-containing protein [Chryseobacterium daecheongense]|uniref:Alcohol dehydrogenase n=1 Tax=Chryseobacterium daecheongense TaxID=192389 RepID=A0ABY2G102_9FLAO|nr:alcohol dehydrogenase catalytic domain-containing protein [Chryseobacterium daecheongense]TDX95326.1 alcohol dehydrogenase [Chryseobacterium daecheongense]
MKAAVFHAPGTITCDTVDDPVIQDANDIILRVTSTAICGSDLHMYSGGIPQARPMVMGHEFMGIVEEREGKTSMMLQKAMKSSIKKKTDV